MNQALQPIRFALLGCGRIAQRYAKLLKDEIPEAILVAACDNKRERAETFSRIFEIPVYDSIHAMMTKESIDCVCILTPSGLHAEHALELLNYHCPLIIEKPLALTLEDADAVINGCHDKNIPLFVVKQNRYNLPIVKLKEALDLNRFGKLIMGTVRLRWCRTPEYYNRDAWRGTWLLDGGVLANQTSHHIDLIEWLMGPISSVTCKGKRFLSSKETEDTAIALLEFENGALGVIEATTATRPEDTEGSITIMGENGLVEIGGFAVNEIKTWQFKEHSFEDKAILTRFSENPPDVYGYGHRRYLEDVIKCLQNQQEPPINGVIGRRNILVLTALYESMESQQTVFVDDFTPQYSRLGKEPHILNHAERFIKKQS